MTNGQKKYICEMATEISLGTAFLELGVFLTNPDIVPPKVAFTIFAATAFVNLCFQISSIVYNNKSR